MSASLLAPLSLVSSLQSEETLLEIAASRAAIKDEDPDESQELNLKITAFLLQSGAEIDRVNKVIPLSFDTRHLSAVGKYSSPDIFDPMQREDGFASP